MSLFYIACAGIAALLSAIALRPLLRSGHTTVGITSLLLCSGLGLGVYISSSTFDPDKPLAAPTVEDQLAILAARTESSPDNQQNWTNYGRALMQQGNYQQAVTALARAYELSDKTDVQAMLDYAAALAESDPSSITGSAGQLVENALRLAPSDMHALWFGASVAAARGEPELAATRFESMLQPGMPDNVRIIIERNIQALRASDSSEIPGDEEIADVAAMRVSVSLADNLNKAYPESAVFFLMATAPEGGPPVAVVKLPVAAIPGDISLGDRDAILPGRNLSSQDAVILTARISLNGQPAASAGDVYGSVSLEKPYPEAIKLVLDSTVTTGPDNQRQ